MRSKRKETEVVRQRNRGREIESAKRKEERTKKGGVGRFR